MSSDDIDIVVLLRHMAGRFFGFPDVFADLNAAADEIERLREEVADLHDGINWHTECLNCARLMSDNYDQLCEIERLRLLAEALIARTKRDDRGTRAAADAADAAYREARS